VVSVQVHYVRPSPCDDVATETDSVLTEECRIQTNLPEDAIRNAQPLELVIDEVSQSVSWQCSQHATAADWLYGFFVRLFSTTVIVRVFITLYRTERCQWS